MCAGGQNAYVIGVVISNESVHGCQAIEILRGAAMQFNFGVDVHFIALPPFDSNRACRRAYDCAAAAISQAEVLVPRYRARQQRRGRLIRLLNFLSGDGGGEREN